MDWGKNHLAETSTRHLELVVVDVTATVQWTLIMHNMDVALSVFNRPINMQCDNYGYNPHMAKDNLVAVKTLIPSVVMF